MVLHSSRYGAKPTKKAKPTDFKSNDSVEIDGWAVWIDITHHPFDKNIKKGKFLADGIASDLFMINLK